MSTNFVDFQDLKERVSIDQVLPLLNIEFKQKGDQWRGACTRCDGGDRSVVITGSKQAWYCFGCKKGGDLIALVSHMNDAPMKDAAIQIAEAQGLLPDNGTVPRNGNSNSTSTSKGTVPKAQGHKEPQKFQPLNYLEPAHEAVEHLGVALETAEAFGAGYAPRGILRGRLALPIHTRDGILVGYCGHSVTKGQQPDLLFPKGFDPAEFIFNAHQLLEGELYLVPDPLDVLTAHQNGVENCVAFLTEEITAQQFEMLASLMDEKKCEFALFA